MYWYLGGQKSDEAAADCQKLLTVKDVTAQKQYFTVFFPKERAEAEKKTRKHALDYVKEKQIPVPDKNAQPTDPTRIVQYLP